MLIQIFIVGAVATLVFALGLVLHTAIACRLARSRFEKQSRGLPIVGGLSVMGNGSLTWALRRDLCASLLDLYRAKQIKTFGWLFHTTAAAMSVDLELIKRIHEEPNKHLNRIGTLHLPMGEIEKSMMLAQDDKWRRLRRSFAPALKSNRFKTPNVLAEVERSIEKLIGLIDSKLEDRSKCARKEAGRSVEMHDLVHRYSLNLVFSCLYKQYDQINFDERPCHWTELIDQGLAATQTSLFVRASILFPILQPLIDWLIYHFHAQGVWRRDVMGFVKRQTKLGFEARKEARQLMASGAPINPDNFMLKDGTKFQRNMIDYVIDQFLDGKLTADEYFDTSCFLLNAADKTSADALTHTLYQLAVNASVQEKLRKSTHEHGTDSEYLGWVLSESLRLMPPANIGASRVLGHDLEIEGGHLLPKGTFVVTPLFVIHRLREYWGEDADEFRPERWRDTSQHHPYQFMPFGAGPRGCPGKYFALFEMKLLLVALLSRYKFEAAVKRDLFHFDSPFLIFLIPNSPTYITIKKLSS